MSKSAKMGAVERNAKGQVVQGSGAINPGGLTAEERQARDALRKWLCVETMEEGKAAYRQALSDGNPAIIKDWADRLLGKVKERVEMSEDPDAPMLGGWSLTDVLAALTAAREKPKT